MYLVVTKEVAEANNVEYLHRLVHMTWVVDVHGKLDDPGLATPVEPSMPRHPGR